MIRQLRPSSLSRVLRAQQEPAHAHARKSSSICLSANVSSDTPSRAHCKARAIGRFTDERPVLVGDVPADTRRSHQSAIRAARPSTLDGWQTTFAAVNGHDSSKGGPRAPPGPIPSRPSVTPRRPRRRRRTRRPPRVADQQGLSASSFVRPRGIAPVGCATPGATADRAERPHPMATEVEKRIARHSLHFVHRPGGRRDAHSALRTCRVDRFALVSRLPRSSPSA